MNASEFDHIREKLVQNVDDSGLLWRYHPKRYDQNDVIEEVVRGISPPDEARIKLKVDRFIGGGFAGQVYRVKLLDIQSSHSGIKGLKHGGIYAVKIGKPPSSFSLWFRNLIYRIAYQAPFAPQLYTAAARSGALWQKLIRRGMRITFGSEKGAVDVYGGWPDANRQRYHGIAGTHQEATGLVGGK